MNSTDARMIEHEAETLMRKIRHQFPCEDCKGEGTQTPYNYPYPEPCPECWGRGYQIPMDDEEEE